LATFFATQSLNYLEAIFSNKKGAFEETSLLRMRVKPLQQEAKGVSQMFY